MFGLSLVISITILLQMGLYVLSLLAGWNMKFNLVAVCYSWLRAFGLSFLEYTLDALVIYTLAFSVWKVMSQWIMTVRMKKQLQQYRDNKRTAEINRNFAKHREAIIVLSHPAPFAITMGIFQPSIMITTGLMSILSDDEMQAVVYHEMYHLKCRDPLRAFLLSLGASMLWYIPIQKWFNLKYRTLQEVLADDFAIGQQGTTVYLAEALLKMLKVGRENHMPFTYVSFADTSVNERIAYMLNPGKAIPLRLPYKNTVFSIMIFSIISGLFIYALS